MLGIAVGRGSKWYNQLASFFQTAEQYGDVRGLFHELRSDRKAAFHLTDVRSGDEEKLMHELCLAGVMFAVPVGTSSKSGLVCVSRLSRRPSVDWLYYYRARLNWILKSRLIRVEPIQE